MQVGDRVRFMRITDNRDRLKAIAVIREQERVVDHGGQDQGQGAATVSSERISPRIIF